MEGCLPAQGWSASGRSGKLMYYVYVLKSDKTGKLYKGFTEDLKNRLREHNAGKNLSTKSGAPWTLVYYEAFLKKKNALVEERFLKSGKGRERLKYILEGCLSG